MSDKKETKTPRCYLQGSFCLVLIARDHMMRETLENAPIVITSKGVLIGQTQKHGMAMHSTLSDDDFQRNGSRRGSTWETTGVHIHQQHSKRPLSEFNAYATLQVYHTQYALKI